MASGLGALISGKSFRAAGDIFFSNPRLLILPVVIFIAAAALANDVAVYRKTDSILGIPIQFNEIAVIEDGTNPELSFKTGGIMPLKQRIYSLYPSVIGGMTLLIFSMNLRSTN